MTKWKRNSNLRLVFELILFILIIYSIASTNQNFNLFVFICVLSTCNVSNKYVLFSNLFSTSLKTRNIWNGEEWKRNAKTRNISFVSYEATLSSKLKWKFASVRLIFCLSAGFPRRLPRDCNSMRNWRFAQFQKKKERKEKEEEGGNYRDKV